MAQRGSGAPLQPEQRSSQFGKDVNGGRYGSRSPGVDETMEQSLGSINVGVSQSQSAVNAAWGMSRPSSPGHSPGVSPSHRYRSVADVSPYRSAEDNSPRSISPYQNDQKIAKSGKQPTTAKEAEELRNLYQQMGGPPGQVRQKQPSPLVARESSQPSKHVGSLPAVNTTARQPTHHHTSAPQVQKRPATPPVSKPTSSLASFSSSLAAVLRVPQVSASRRLFITAPKHPEIQGKYFQVGRKGLWVNSAIGSVEFYEREWRLRLKDGKVVMVSADETGQTPTTCNGGWKVISETGEWTTEPSIITSHTSDEQQESAEVCLSLYLSCVKTHSRNRYQ